MQRIIMKKIEITEHARQRLIERMPEVREDQHAKLVKNARYYGKTACIIAKESPEFAEALFKRFRADNSTQIRVYQNCVFIFFGTNHHARKLKTVVNIPKHILALQGT